MEQKKNAGSIPGRETEKNGRRTAAIVLAAGQGKRMNSPVAKQFMELEGRPLVVHSLQAFEDCPAVDTVILVTGAGEISYCREEVTERYGLKKVSAVIAGGAERYDSVFAGLEELRRAGFPEDGAVLIHDGARPLVSEELILRAVDGAEQFHACAAAVPVKDTIKTADADGFCSGTLKRSELWQIQTPQAFLFGLIHHAYKKMFSGEEYRKDVTDDAMVVEKMTDRKVRLIAGDYSNIKVTTPEDMAVAAALMKLRG